MLMPGALFVMASLAGSLGCDSGSTSPAADATADGAATDAKGADANGHDAQVQMDTISDVVAGDLVLSDAMPPSPYQEVRGLIHLHSIYSHDGCDDQGFINGQPNTQCLQELRDALCTEKFDFVMLSDHPSHMSDYTLVEDMLHEAAAGDQLVQHQGKPIANRITCSNGHQALVSVGFESKHMMPLGLFDKPSMDDLYLGIDDSSDLTQVKQQVQALKDLGAVVAMVHSEEPDISASVIDDGGFEAMEWYNIHANFSTLIGKDTLSADVNNIPQLTTLVSKILGLNDFMTNDPSGSHPDLVYLLFLDVMPTEGFDKWRTVQQSRSITGILGSDIHRNVVVDASMCAGVMQLVCAGALALVEGSLGSPLSDGIKNLLLQGGNIIMSDGERVDSYARLMRWMENRVLASSKDQLAIQDALRAGRVYGVYTVFGDPSQFYFVAEQGGNTLQMGETASGSALLRVGAPGRPVFMELGGAPFTQADALNAELRTRLMRIDGAGTSLVHEENGLGVTITKQVTQPGAYYVEIRITPKHLTAALGTAQALASKEYLWVISNPIFVEP